MADVSFPRLEASCGHGPAAFLTGTRICTACLPVDRVRCETCAGVGHVKATHKPDNPYARALCSACGGYGTVESRGLPRPLGEQLVEGFTRILGTPREPEDQARQLAQWLTLEFDIMRRSIR